jgi:hypothetical protein
MPNVGPPHRFIPYVLAKKAVEFSAAFSVDNGSPYLKVRLAIDKGKRARQLGLISDRLMIADITSNTDKSFSKRDVDLELNTMPDTGLIDSRHWIAGVLKNNE